MWLVGSFFIFLSFVLLPSIALACTCYTASGSAQPVDNTVDCQQACNGDLNATESNGQCTCSDLVRLEHPTLNCDAMCVAEGLSSTVPAGEERPIVSPQLGVQIPGLSFSKVLQDSNSLTINFIGEYISGLYRYLLGISLTIAIVMVMIGGLQYVLGGASQEQVSKGKDRIEKAVIGLVLLLSVYVILFTVNPRLVVFEGLTIPIVQRHVENTTLGEEGATGGGTASDCQEAITKAKSEGACNMTMKFASPTGSPPACNYHFRDKAYDYKTIDALDYAASWGSPVLAPFDGRIEVTKGTGTSSRCGNNVRLTGSGGTATFCHMKDFIDENGNARATGQTVTQGSTLGHIGGNCCSGETAPESWSQADKCTKPGPPCNDPFTAESCSCQPVAQSGNTSGPHVHVTFSSGGDLLACLE